MLTSRHHNFLAEVALFNQLCWFFLFSLTSIPEIKYYQDATSSNFMCHLPGSLLSSPGSYNPPTYMSSLLPRIRYISKLTYLKLVLDLPQNMLSISNVLFSVNGNSHLPFAHTPNLGVLDFFFIFLHHLSNPSANLLALLLEYVWNQRLLITSFQTLEFKPHYFEPGL